MAFELTTYQAYDFANRRHIGPSPSEMDEMLKVIGFDSLDALIDATVPPTIRQQEPLEWGDAMSERDALFHMKKIASKNKVLTSLIGQGYYGTTTPAPILRNILENPAWYTAYTPYQPEISQGRLEALLNFRLCAYCPVADRGGDLAGVAEGAACVFGGRNAALKRYAEHVV